MTNAQILKVVHFPYQEFDERGNRVYREESDGYWIKREYDHSGDIVYWENSYGKIWRK